MWEKSDPETKMKRKKRLAWVDPVVIVHGGAGNIPPYARKFMLDEVKKIICI